MKCVLFMLLSYIVVITYQWQQFKPGTYKQEFNSEEIYNRMVTLMQTIHREGRRRHTTLDTIRFFYEKSPHYEMGYIMGEIIERYRKMVNHVRTRHTFKGTYVFWMVKKVQTIQHLYFEIFHLTGMLHEIEAKFQMDTEFSNIHSELTMKELAELQKQINEVQREREREQKRELKKQLKAKKITANQMGRWPVYVKPTRPKGYWPIEYGWDIGNTW